MTGEHYMALIRPEQAQGKYVRQTGYVTFAAKTASVTTNLSTIVYANAHPKQTNTSGGTAASGFAKGLIIWTSGVVSSNAVTFRRISQLVGICSAPVFWYEIVGYP